VHSTGPEAYGRGREGGDLTRNTVSDPIIATGGGRRQGLLVVGYLRFGLGRRVGRVEHLLAQARGRSCLPCPDSSITERRQRGGKSGRPRGARFFAKGAWLGRKLSLKLSPERLGGEDATREEGKEISGWP